MYAVLKFDRVRVENTITRRYTETDTMKLKVIIHQAEEGGYWAEVPAIPGCATQGEDLEELIQNIYDAVEECLSVDVASAELGDTDRVMELAV